MKKIKISFDQYRRQARRQLFLKRQKDNDNSEARLFYDAQKLDALLKKAGFKLPYTTEWSKHFDEKRHLKRLKGSPRTHLEGSQTHLNLMRD